jgi:hypothetical protein
MTQTHDTYCRLLDGLKEAKSALAKLDADWVRNLSEDDLAIVIPAFAEFYNSMKSAANYLAVLREQHRA